MCDNMPYLQWVCLIEEPKMGKVDTEHDKSHKNGAKLFFRTFYGSVRLLPLQVSSLYSSNHTT